MLLITKLLTSILLAGVCTVLPSSFPLPALRLLKELKEMAEASDCLYGRFCALRAFLERRIAAKRERAGKENVE
jgi:hypothetical protein